MLLPYQSFVQAYRPVAAGIARIAGWGTPAGGYGNGNLAYLDPSNNAYVIGDTEILDEIKRILPAATTVWVAIVP